MLTCRRAREAHVLNPVGGFSDWTAIAPRNLRMSEPTWRLAATDRYYDEFAPASFRWLTQIGGRKFKEQPQWHRELSLSVQAGRHSPAEAVPLCFRRPAVAKDRVRFFGVPLLVAAGYLPYASPFPGNPDHADIRALILDNDPELHITWWAREDRVTLQELARE
ncbi:hypothetical protein GCM10027535_03420 [Mycolicibacterium hippocampi]|uniref:Uncharacterized protein n=1 Tax=Mycolicibacterium hippocampi TaxID=659824 RepID=A0A7I9ZQH3_9MYCO|nr:hypothetical protein MHIP_37570 [Mycolicibacterium hippocampi]